MEKDQNSMLSMLEAFTKATEINYFSSRKKNMFLAVKSYIAIFRGNLHVYIQLIILCTDHISVSHWQSIKCPILNSISMFCKV